MELMSSSEDEAGTSLASNVSRLFDPQRLRQGRYLSRMTKQSLAGAVGVSSAAIGQYEAGIATPRPEVLELLARELKVPVGFFAAGRPFSPLTASETHFKTLRSTTANERNKALAYTEQVWELAHALERWVQFPPLNLPVDEQERPFDRAHLRSAAELLRDMWGVAQDVPFPHLTRMAEANGIITVFASFAGDEEVRRVSAFSTSRLSRPIVVTPPDRIDDVFVHRFNLAHEIGHLILHREEVHGDVEIEREANKFAAELLLPERTMRNLLSARVDWARLTELSAIWGVEVSSLIYRTRELGILSDASARRAYQRLTMMKSSGLIKPSPTARYEGEVPVLLRRAFEYAETQGVTQASLAADLHWPLATVQLLLGSGDSRPKLQALL